MTLSTESKEPISIWMWIYGILAVAAIITICFELGYPELQSVHEARVVATARSMVRNGEWVVPVFNDNVRLEKPPLPYWSVGLFYLLTGKINETVARLPSVILGVVGTALGAAGAAVIFGQMAGYGAALFALLMLRYQLDMRTAEVDLYLSFCVALCFWLLAVIFYGQKRRDWLWLWLGVAGALGGLAKGPAIFVFVVPMIVVGWLLAPDRRPRAVWLLGALAIFLALSAIWPVLLVNRLGWDTVREVWFSDLERNVAWTQRRMQPFYYYLPRFLMLTYPWSVLATAALLMPLWREVRAQSTYWKKTLWISVSIVSATIILSFARKKKIDYLLPVVPLISALLSAALDQLAANIYSKTGSPKLSRWLLYGQASVFMACGVMGFLYIPLDPLKRVGLLAVMSAALLLGGIGAVVCLLKNQVRAAFVSTCVGMLVFMAGLYGQFVVDENVRISPGQFCQKMNELIGPAPVVYFKGFDETLVYHLDRTIHQVDNVDQLREFLQAYPNAFIVCRYRDLSEAQTVAGHIVMHHPRLRDMELPVPKKIYDWVSRRYHAQDENVLGDSGYYYNLYVLTADPWDKQPVSFEPLLARSPRWLNAQTLWVGFGLLAQTMFFLRFVVQWLASERAKMSVMPIAFWWLSLTGGLMLLIYSIWRKDPVFIIGQATGVFIYLRNLWLIYLSPKPDLSRGSAEE